MRPKPPTAKYFFSISQKSVKNSDGVERVPISSSNYDRDNDRMTEDFLLSMADQINTGHVALYADHGWGEHGFYSAYDKLGSWSDAVIENGVLYATPVLSDAKIVADKVEAVRDMLESNTPVSWSIGFMPTKWDANDEDGMDFKDGDLMETSIVGIPANPDAVSSMRAFKNIFKLIKQQDEEDDEMDDDEKSIETLEDALGWMAENAPETVTDIIVNALKEDEEEDEEDDEEEEEETEGEGEDDDDDDDDEDKGVTDDESFTRAEIIEIVKEAMKSMQNPEPEQKDETPEVPETPETHFKDIAIVPKPKGHAPAGPEGEPEDKGFFKRI